MTTLQNTIERAIEKAFETTMLVQLTGGRRVAFKSFLRETIRKAVEEAFAATTPEKRSTSIFHSTNDGDFVENDWGDCLNELRTKQSEYLAQTLQDN